MGHWVYKWGLLVRNSGEQSVGHMTNLKYSGLEIRSMVFRAIRLFFLWVKERFTCEKEQISPIALLQGREFAHLLIAHSLSCSFCSNQMSDCERLAQIAQDKWATVSDSLRSLRGNKQPWANNSGRSRQMINREQLAQVAHDKWGNERFAQKMLAQKKSKILFLSMFYIRFFCLKNERIAHSPFFGERCEWRVLSCLFHHYISSILHFKQRGSAHFLSLCMFLPAIQMHVSLQKIKTRLPKNTTCMYTWEQL